MFEKLLLTSNNLFFDNFLINIFFKFPTINIKWKINTTKIFKKKQLIFNKNT